MAEVSSVPEYAFPRRAVTIKWDTVKEKDTFGDFVFSRTNPQEDKLVICHGIFNDINDVYTVIELEDGSLQCCDFKDLRLLP